MDYVSMVERCRRDACELARQWTKQQCKQCSIELESGGNIKFTAGDPHLSSWYKSCSDLVNSRFSVDKTPDVVSVAERILLTFHSLFLISTFAVFPPPLLQGVSVTGIQVKAITRLENRMLYNRLETLINQLHRIFMVDTSLSLSLIFEDSMTKYVLFWTKKLLASPTLTTCSLSGSQVRALYLPSSAVVYSSAVIMFRTVLCGCV